MPARASIGGYAAYGIYRVTEAILRLLPMEAVCVIGSCMGQAGYFLMHRRRRIVMRNLRIAYGENLSLPEIRALTRKTFRHSGLNLMASIPASVIDNDELKERVEVEGLENLHHALGQNQGCILLLAHMGNWEILTQLKVLAPGIQSLASLYRPLNNPLLDRLIKRRRQRKGAILFSKYDSFTKPITHIKQGGTLGCIADQHAGSRGTAIPLFGKTTSMTSLPALLHRKTKAPILPVSMITVGLGQWKVIFHPSINVLETEKKNTYLLTARCAKAYERIMSESPSDVLWMHGYWKVNQSRPLHIDGLKKQTINTATSQPFQVLIYTGEYKSSDDRVVTQLHRLQNYRSDIRIITLGKHPILPSADHHIYCDPAEPPHLIYNKILFYDRHSSAPIDCALNFTADGAGKNILTHTQFDHVFCRQGKWVSRHTQAIWLKHGTVSIPDFLTSIGLNDLSDT